ncbi:MAG: KGK domain-containing protein [Coleofasciculaceae cyanobacterium]
MFKLLDYDWDVLLFDQDTYTVGRFKKLLVEDFESKLSKSFLVQDYANNSHYWHDTKEDFIRIKADKFLCDLSDIKWNSTDKDCQILRVGSQGWQRGKIRFEIIFSHESDRSKVRLEFCGDEATRAELHLQEEVEQLTSYSNGLSHL